MREESQQILDSMIQTGCMVYADGPEMLIPVAFANVGKEYITWGEMGANDQHDVHTTKYDTVSVIHGKDVEVLDSEGNEVLYFASPERWPSNMVGNMVGIERFGDLHSEWLKVLEDKERREEYDAFFRSFIPEEG